MARRKGPEVIVVAGKGGDTKTTTTGAVADAAARTGLRVLAVDLDAQGTLTRWLAPDAAGGALHAQPTPVWGTGVVDQGSAYLDVLGASAGLGQLEQGDQRETLGDLVRSAAEAYDVLVFDTAAWRPAGPSAALQLAALWHATRVLLPMEPAAASVFNLTEVLATVAEVGRLRRKALPVSLLPTRMGAREADAAATVTVLGQLHHALPPVRRSAYARRAMLEHLTLSTYAERTPRARDLAADYAAATAELLTVMPSPKSTRTTARKAIR